MSEDREMTDIIRDINNLISGLQQQLCEARAERDAFKEQVKVIAEMSARYEGDVTFNDEYCMGDGKVAIAGISHPISREIGLYIQRLVYNLTLKNSELINENARLLQDRRTPIDDIKQSIKSKEKEVAELSAKITRMYRSL